MGIETIAAGVGIAGGLNSMFGGGSSSGGQTSQQAQQASDPFASYRPGEAAQYNNAMKSGGTVDPTQMPGYSQWMSGVLNPAMESTQGKEAAAGMSGSGAEKQALQGVGQQGYYSFMTEYMNRLAQGSGAVQNPASGGAAGTSQGNQQANAFSSGLGGVATGLGGLFGANTASAGSGGGYVSPGGYVSSSENPYGGATSQPSSAYATWSPGQ